MILSQNAAEDKLVPGPKDFKVPVNLTPEQDAQLIANGYEPAAVFGKRPVADAWSKGDFSADRIAAERARYPDASSTGFLTRRLSVPDIDLVSEEHTAAHIKLAMKLLGNTSLVRHGSKGAAMLYRAETLSSKITITTSKPLPGGKSFEKIEILGDGQQVVGFGIHPATNEPYEWIIDDPNAVACNPLNVPRASLPEVTPEQLKAYAIAAKALLEDQGYGPVTISGDTGERAEPKATTGKRVTWLRFAERLSWIHPQFDGRRPDCYPQPDTRKLPYDAGVWLGIGLCLRDGNIPWLGDEPSREERIKLLEDWSDGTWWFERTFTDANVTTVPEQGVEARLGGRERDGGPKTTIATIIKYAADAGCPLPPDDEPQATAAETFAGFADKIEEDKKPDADDAPDADGFTRSGGLSYRSMQSITPAEIDWLWPNRIAAGKLTLIAGAPDDGKSQIAANLAATISNGGSWPFGEGTIEQGAVIWLSAEDTAADITVPRLMAAGANLRLIFELEATVRVEGGVRTFNIVDDLDELTTMIATIEREYNVPVKAIMIDPISAYMGGRSKGDTWKNSDVRNIMTPLLTFIGKAGVSVVGITHFNKSNDANVLNRVIDSMALPAISRTTLLTATEKDDDGTPTGRRLLLKGKQNIGRPVSGLAYRIKEALVPNGKGGTMTAPFVAWDGIVAVTADEAMTEHKGTEGKLEAAKDFLMRVLIDGPVTEKEIRKRAGEKHRWRTLQRAKEKLGILSERAGGLAGTGEWQWVPPRDEPVKDDDPDAALFAKPTRQSANEQTSHPALAV